MSDAGAPRRVLFVTGKLAEPALRRVLAELSPPFTYDVAGAAVYLASPAASFLTGQTMFVGGGVVM